MRCTRYKKWQKICVRHKIYSTLQNLKRNGDIFNKGLIRWVTNLFKHTNVRISIRSNDSPKKDSDGKMWKYCTCVFRSHYGPGIDSASDRNEYRGYFLGGKGGRCVRMTNLPPCCAVVMKSGNLNFLETSGPVTWLLEVELKARFRKSRAKIDVAWYSNSCDRNIS